MAIGTLPLLWKRDSSKAFRRLGVAPRHMDLSWILWKESGKFYTSQHIGLPLGCIAAVHAWHRVVALVTAFIGRILRAPAFRYVDDMFGASKVGVFWSAGRCLDVITAILGLPLDADKSEDSVLSLIVLGARVVVSRSEIALAVAEEKAAFWVTILITILITGICTAATAREFVGRLSFTVSLAANRVGRA